jgi:hypothetical protein
MAAFNAGNADITDIAGLASLGKGASGITARAA